MALSVNRLSSNSSSTNRRWWLAFGIYMNDINQLFYQLIRVAIGNQVCLSHTPSADEWGKLYALAKKQSLVGICFAGVQRLQAQRQAPNSWGSPEGEMLYLQLMGMAAKIQQRNEVLNRRCAELQAKLSDCGMRSAILKGQGMASLYKLRDESLELRDLSTLRQSGDIDVWVDGSMEATIQTLKSAGIEVGNVNIKHAEAKFLEGTEVEIHFVPTWFYNPETQGKLTQWIERSKDAQMTNLQNGLVVPTIEFNLVYSLIHLFRHTLDEGVGLRQLMDYYFILQALEAEADLVKKFNTIANAKRVVADLSLTEFASGVIWVMNRVFGEQHVQVWEANEKYGRFLLNVVIDGGNFGAYREGKQGYSSNAFTRGCRNLRRIAGFASYFPGEVLCAPFWKMWHWCWRKKYYSE